MNFADKRAERALLESVGRTILSRSNAAKALVSWLLRWYRLGFLFTTALLLASCTPQVPSALRGLPTTIGKDGVPLVDPVDLSIRNLNIGSQFPTGVWGNGYINMHNNPINNLPIAAVAGQPCTYGNVSGGCNNGGGGGSGVVGSGTQGQIGYYPGAGTSIAGAGANNHGLFLFESGSTPATLVGSTAGQILYSAGASADPAFAGTNNHGLFAFESGAAPNTLAGTTAAQLLFWAASGDPTWITVTGDTTFPSPGVSSTTKLNGSTPGGTCAASNWVNVIDNHAIPACTRPTFADISGLVNLATQSTGAINAATQLSGIVAQANGGNGSASPGLVAGTNVTITGSWPNQTINSTAAGGGGGGGSGSNTIVGPNDTGTGTTADKLVSLTAAPSTAIITGVAATSGAIGICQSGCGKTGNATIVNIGLANCVFDGATTANHYVRISTTVAGDCQDAGAGYPSSGEVVGRILSTNGGGGDYQIDIFPPEMQAATGGGGSGADTTLTTITGTTAGTATCYMPWQVASEKKAKCWLSGYQNATGSAQTYSFATAFTNKPFFAANVVPPASVTTAALSLPSNMTAIEDQVWIEVDGF